MTCLIRFCKSAPLVLALALPSLAGAQAPPAQSSPGAEVSFSSRYSQTLQVPAGGRTIAVSVVLGSWRIEKAKQAIQLPMRGFFVAELMNGSAITVIAGRETLRNSGELWVVPAGALMRIKAAGAHQENVLLHIFAVSPAS